MLRTPRHLNPALLSELDTDALRRVLMTMRNESFLDLLSKYPLITEFHFGAILCSTLDNENSSFDNLNLTFLMQVVLSVTLSRLYCVLGDFHVSTNTLMKNFLLVF